MNNSMKYMEEIKIEPLNIHNEAIKINDTNDDLMDLNLDRGQDSARSKTADTHKRVRKLILQIN